MRICKPVGFLKIMIKDLMRMHQVFAFQYAIHSGTTDLHPSGQAPHTQDLLST